MRTKLIDRVKRFIKGFNPKVSTTERQLVYSILNEKQLKLYNGMSLFDQRHCLDVLQTLLKKDPEVDLLTKQLCLLHDIGKQRSSFPVIARALVVIFPRNPQQFINKPLQKSGINTWWYLKYSHPFYGSELAKSVGLNDDLSEMILYHHHSPPVNERVQKFQWADNLN